ncbi:MAG TPA: hypothetical protein VGI39_45035 [Polyangiaceae bacterium]
MGSRNLYASAILLFAGALAVASCASTTNPPGDGGLCLADGGCGSSPGAQCTQDGDCPTPLVCLACDGGGYSCSTGKCVNGSCTVAAGPCH